MKKNRTILITGASSGIGKALAVLYAAPDTTLYLTGRNNARLQEVEALCLQRGAMVDTLTLNVTDRTTLEAQLLAWDKLSPIDIVVANAGISSGSSTDAKQAETQLRDVIETNLIGTFNTVNPLIPLMQARGQGQIVLMSSMAGFRGMPNAPAYSTSKVAVRAYGDALRPLLKPDGITVTTIFPGFVKTSMTDVNTFSMPFLMEVERAAEIIQHGIDTKKAFIAFPWPTHFVSWLLGVLPRLAGDWILTHGPEKS